MLRHPLCTILAATILFQSMATAQTAASAPSGNIAGQVHAFPAGTYLEAKLSSGDRIAGVLGEITDKGFELQNISQGQVLQSWTIAFDDVRSIQRKHPPSKLWQVTKWTLITIAVVGTATGLVFWAAANR